jgi:PhnB protein
MAKAKARKKTKAKRPALPRAKKAPGPVAGAPVGYHTLTPGFCVRGALEALDFYKKAFGATERMRMTKPDGTTLAHAELKIGDSLFMLGEEDPAMGAKSAQTLGGSSVNFYIYVKAVDAAVEKALAAGAKTVMPVTDMFWGDRIGGVEDPYGQKWTLATHKENVSPREMQKRAEAFYARSAGSH